VLTTILAVGLLVVWIAFEFIFRGPGDAASLAGSSSDRWTTPLLVIGYGCAVALPFLIGTWSSPSWGIAWLGILAGGLGLVVRASGMRALGGAYTRNLRTTESQSLITNGPYRYIRHPGYLGSILVWVGASLAFGGWPVAAAVAIILGIAYAWRITSEEAMLSARFGEEWRTYTASTARVIPGVWWARRRWP
jgi:protein-S-isoprenylcysteine O-methyltransferase Ste14